VTARTRTAAPGNPQCRGPLPELEEDFQHWCLEAAHLYRWLVVHSRPARVGNRGRWATPIQGDKGAPDLLLARDGVVFLRELKRDTTYPDPKQRDWLRELGEHAAVWRPRDRELILLELKTGRRHMPL